MTTEATAGSWRNRIVGHTDVAPNVLVPSDQTHRALDRKAGRVTGEAGIRLAVTAVNGLGLFGDEACPERPGRPSTGPTTTITSFGSASAKALLICRRAQADGYEGRRSPSNRPIRGRSTIGLRPVATCRTICS